MTTSHHPPFASEITSRTLKNFYTKLIEVYEKRSYGWTKGTMARDDKNHPCALKDASKVCLLGALDIVLSERHRHWDEKKAVRTAIIDHILSRIEENSIANFNDARSMTKAKLLKKLKQFRDVL